MKQPMLMNVMQVLIVFNFWILLILINLLSESKGFKFVKILVLEFTNIRSDDKLLYSTFLSNSKAEPIINESEIHDAFESAYCAIGLLYQTFKNI